MSINYKELKEKGYIDNKIDNSINIVDEINKLKRNKNAVLLAHYYQEDEVQDIADFVGDSLALSQKAAKTKADIIVFAGVHFMAETAKILAPNKKVLLHDLNAGCSLAESYLYEDLEKFKKKYPDHIVISYVNTTASIKALSDVVCTSTNAVQIVESFPKNEKIIFTPDRNLGNYVNSITGRKMVIWNGACHINEKFSLERILKLKEEKPKAKLIAHPECEKPILIIADHIGSTYSLLKFTVENSAKEFIVATESGIIHQMKKNNPGKIFIPAPTKDSACGCNDCNFMKLITIKKIYNCLKYEQPEIVLNEEIRIKAEVPIIRMLKISEKLGL